MTDRSNYFIESVKRIMFLKLVAAYLTIIEASAACKDLFIRAGKLLDKMLDFEQKLNTSSKAFTIAGQEIRKAAADDFSTIAKVLGSYGLKINDPELIGCPKRFNYWKLCKGTVLEQLTDSITIMKLVNDNSAALADYNIDANYISNLEMMATKLEQMTKLPTDIIKQHASYNKQYLELEKLAKKFFDGEMDTFMEVYKKTEEDFYYAYRAARKARHHHLKRKPAVTDPENTTGTLETLILFKDTTEPAPGVNLLVTALNISETSDEDGETYNDELAPGTYHGKLTLEGYKDVEFDFTIVAGETCTLQFLMEKIV